LIFKLLDIYCSTIPEQIPFSMMKFSGPELTEDPATVFRGEKYQV
jgi:hypothetical protein